MAVPVGRSHPAGALEWSVVAYLFALVGIVHAFVLLYEEPVLRAKFGEEYKQYCTRVNRWLPQRPRMDA